MSDDRNAYRKLLDLIDEVEREVNSPNRGPAELAYDIFDALLEIRDTIDAEKVAEFEGDELTPEDKPKDPGPTEFWVGGAPTPSVTTPYIFTTSDGSTTGNSTSAMWFTSKARHASIWVED